MMNRTDFKIAFSRIRAGLECADAAGAVAKQLVDAPHDGLEVRLSGAVVRAVERRARSLGFYTSSAQALAAVRHQDFLAPNGRLRFYFESRLSPKHQHWDEFVRIARAERAARWEEEDRYDRECEAARPPAPLRAPIGDDDFFPL